jgi:hypothetical protein
MDGQLSVCGCPSCERNALAHEPERISALNLEFVRIVHNEWTAADEANARLLAERECKTTLRSILAEQRMSARQSPRRTGPGIGLKRQRWLGPNPPEGWDSA